MKSIAMLFFVLIISTNAKLVGQKYFTKTGEITFFGATAMEDIKATSGTASSVIDLSDGKIQWAVLMKSFNFSRALMQEHFNENYMESTKFPKAKFSGIIENFSALNLTKDGEYTMDIVGKLEMHGVEKDVKTKAKFIVKGGKITASSVFNVAVADYNIEIPSVVKDKIAKIMEITVKSNYALLDKI